MKKFINVTWFSFIFAISSVQTIAGEGDEVKELPDQILNGLPNSNNQSNGKQTDTKRVGEASPGTDDSSGHTDHRSHSNRSHSNRSHSNKNFKGGAGAGGCKTDRKLDCNQKNEQRELN